MSMTTQVDLRYEGPDSCLDCQRTGIPRCGHIGFNPEAWDGLVGRAVTVPGLDTSDQYVHTLGSYAISDDRKTVTLHVSTDRARFHDLARHLSVRPEVQAKAAVRAVHHESGEVLEEGFYDRPLAVGMRVAIDRDLYDVRAVEHPGRNEYGIAADRDVQIAHLVPVDPPGVGLVDGGGDPGGVA